MVQLNPNLLLSNLSRGTGSMAYAGSVVVAAIVVILTASTPWLAAGPRALIETAFQTLCHQRADRSFAVNGIPFAVCHRCFGIYTGILLGLIGSKFGARFRDKFERNVPVVVASMLLPMVLDWALDVAGLLSNTAITRYVTGLLAGGAGGLFLGFAFSAQLGQAVAKKTEGAVS